MKRILSVFACISTLLTCSFVLCGCKVLYKGYFGEYTDAYTEACYSLPFSYGCEDDNHYQGDPCVNLIEEDGYGRRLFCYYERQLYHTEENDKSIEKRIVSLLICQKAEDNYVFYYPDVNYCSAFTEKYERQAGVDVFEDPLAEFEEDELKAFKERNDWNKELSLEKCIKREFISKKIKVEIEEQVVDNICRDLPNVNEYKYPELYYLCDDEYGRMLFGLEHSVEHRIDLHYYLVILNPDFTYDKNTFSKQIFGPFNCQEEMKELKQNNNWNVPIEQNVQ